MTSLWKRRYLAGQQDKGPQWQPAETFDFRRNDEFLRDLKLANIRARNTSIQQGKPSVSAAEEPSTTEVPAPSHEVLEPHEVSPEPAAESQEQYGPRIWDRKMMLEEDLPGYPAPPPIMSDLDLIERLRSYFARYLFCSDRQLTILAFWALHTHCFANLPLTPYLNISSPERESGKSRCLQLLAWVCENSWLTSGISASVLLPKVISDKPTVLLDDWHTAFPSTDRQSITGFLITGSRHSGLHHVHEPKTGQSEAVTVFCPKAFAGAGPLPPSPVKPEAVSTRIALKVRLRIMFTG